MTARRKPAQPTHPAGRPSVVFRRGRNGDTLPEWAPNTPRGGWTVEAAFAAALGFADDVAESTDRPRRAVVSEAFAALLTSTPGLRREHIVERMRGNDPYRDHFNPPHAEAAESVEDTDDEPLPF